MSGYILPEGNVQISFSGGRTSAFMLYKILQANGDLPDRVRVLFQNTGRELPETIDFVQECSDKWGVKIEWLEYDVSSDNSPTFNLVSYSTANMTGDPFDKLINKYNAIPMANKRFCTGELKMDTARRYLKSIGWSSWTNTLGIRTDEPKRVKPNKRKFITNWYPLVDANHNLEDVLSFWSKQNFDLNLPVVNGKTMGGNCDFCFLKSESSLAHMYKQYPERIKWWIDAESRVGKTFKENKSYEGLANFIDAQYEWVFNDEAYLCQKDDGECTG